MHPGEKIQTKEKTMKEAKLSVAVFKGKEASVNSYVFDNGHSVVVMDVLRNSAEASQLAEVIRQKQLPLTHILITHGHPDHYIGMDALLKAFPEVKVVVASQAVKADIIGFSIWMESVGWLEAEPNLKPKTAHNPHGFDYEGVIEVLPTNELTLAGGGTLEISTAYAAAEAEHLTTVYAKDLNALFTSDFCYNGVHLWLGQGVDQAHIDNWKRELNKLKATYDGTDVTIYPGHGAHGTTALFDGVLKYLADFEQAIAASNTKEEAMSQMKALYPTWQQDSFLLDYSVDYHMGLKAG